MLTLVAVVLVLAGCTLTVDVAVEVEEDGSGVVTVSAVADAELLERAPGALSDLRLDDLRQAGWTVAGPASTADDGAQVRLSKPFRTPAEATAILAELNGPAGPLRDLQVTAGSSFATRSYGFRGRAQLEGGLEAFTDSALTAALGRVPFADVVAGDVADGLRLVVRVRLPGELASGNGQVTEGGAAAEPDGGDVTTTGEGAPATPAGGGSSFATRPPEPGSTAEDQADASWVASRWEPVLAGGQATDMALDTEIRDAGAQRSRLVERVAYGALMAMGVVALGGLVLVLARGRR